MKLQSFGARALGVVALGTLGLIGSTSSAQAGQTLISARVYNSSANHAFRPEMYAAIKVERSTSRVPRDPVLTMTVQATDPRGESLWGQKPTVLVVTQRAYLPGPPNPSTCVVKYLGERGGSLEPGEVVSVTLIHHKRQGSNVGPGAQRRHVISGEVETVGNGKFFIIGRSFPAEGQDTDFPGCEPGNPVPGGDDDNQ